MQTKSSATNQENASSQPPPPVLQVTRYDLATSFLIAVVIGLVIAVVWLGVVWAVNRPESEEGPVPLEMVELPGGDEDGAVDETLELQSPEDPTDDPSLAEVPADEPEIQEMLETVIEMADEATNLAQQQFEMDARNAGNPGSASGTGRRALGMGPGESGIPREQRWLVRFSDRSTLEEYARQLDFFGIELGALLPNGKLIYLSNLSADRPQKRETTSGKNEKRLYMTWRGGSRREADRKLFEKAGVDVSGARIMHFYPSETEKRLATLEQRYRNRPVDEIRRTYFVVLRNGRNYRFEVTRQIYFE